MITKKYIVLVSLVCLFSCAGQEEPIANTTEVPATANGKLVSKPEKHKAEKLVIESVQVLSARKVRDPHSNYFKEYKSQCKDWKPTKAEVTEIFQNSKVIDGQEYHYNYEILPCYVIGKVIINCNIKAKYELNAGASAVILLPDTAYFLGYYGKKHFLTYRAEY